MNDHDLKLFARDLAENRRSWRDPSVRDLFAKLRGDRNFATLAELTEKSARFHASESTLRRLQVQALIDSGQPATAISVIESMRAHVPEDDPEMAELQGLLGRAYKQILVEGGDTQDAAHRGLLRQALAAYRSAYQGHPERYWQGVNLLALGYLGDHKGLARANPERTQKLAQRVIAAARKSAVATRDPWAFATIAEASVALNNPAAMESALRDFLNAEGLEAFHVGSLLRQLVQVWQLEGKAWAGALAALRARHAQLPGADATLLSAKDVQLTATSDQLKPEYERILGRASGMVTWEWWQLANQRALGVAAVRDDNDSTIGTAFLVDGGSLLEQWAGKTLALTNYHVVNREGIAKGIRPEIATLVFEAIDPKRRHAISRILWESPPHQFDCSVLQLDPPPPAPGVAPIAKRLPLKDPPSRVYIIGHPNGRGLEFSINDNELLDHDEGRSLVTRLHYRAPTEGGSSGSPVFKQATWEAVAIHHAYTESRLNGLPGTYKANEGIGLQSLRAALAADAPNLPHLNAL